MVHELKEVWERVETLTKSKQRELANLLKQEMDWESSFESSQEELAKLAAEALHDFKTGKTVQKDW